MDLVCRALQNIPRWPFFCFTQTNKKKKIEDTSVETRTGAKSTVISGALHTFIIVQKNPHSHKTLNKQVVTPFLL